MKIGLISDSHVPAATRYMPEQVFRAFEGVDLILHAGDIYTEAALDALETVAPVLAVAGPSADRAIQPPRVEVRRILTLGGLKIGLTHELYILGINSEIFAGIIATQLPPARTVRGSLLKTFGQDIDVCVFGDTHHDIIERHEGVLLVNPGSPTLPRHMMRLGTVGILEIMDGEARAEILNLTDFPGPVPSYL